MNNTQILNENGFIQLFPFVNCYRKQSVTKTITINTMYILKKNDVVSDNTTGLFYYKVSCISLQNNILKEEVLIFKNIENVLHFLNKTY